MNKYMSVHGTGLILNEEEFQQFLRNYTTCHAKLYDVTYVDEMENLISLDCIPLIRSKDKDKPNKADYLTDDEKAFHIRLLEWPITQGVSLLPYMVDGKPNTEYKSPKTYKDSENLYLIWSDKQLNTAAALCFDKPYADYQALLSEFKDKCDAYLPKTFDWDSHIGIFDYVIKY